MAMVRRVSFLLAAIHQMLTLTWQVTLVQPIMAKASLAAALRMSILTSQTGYRQLLLTGA